MANDFSLRPAEEGDIPAIAAIYGDAVLSGTASYELEAPSTAEMKRRWQEVVEGGFPYLVADSHGAVLGYSYARPYRPRPAYRFTVEDSVYIAPHAHRRGLGRALLSSLIERCALLGLRQMVAVIGGGIEHPASLRLHESLGFRRIGMIEGSGFKFGRWHDTMLMQRALGPGTSSLPEELESAVGRRPAEILHQRMVGVWRLISRIDRAHDRSIRTDPALGSDPLAMLTYTRDRFAAQFMKRDRSGGLAANPNGSGENNNSAIGGYDAYFGTYHVGEDSVVIHKLDAALNPSNVGMETSRTLSVEGDTLTLVLRTTTQEGEPVTRTLIWERIG
jgi:phosphinothricin acetyltransferase